MSISTRIDYDEWKGIMTRKLLGEDSMSSAPHTFEVLDDNKEHLSAHKRRFPMLACALCNRLLDSGCRMTIFLRSNCGRY
eukprot:g21668.t1